MFTTWTWTVKLILPLFSNGTLRNTDNNDGSDESSGSSDEEYNEMELLSDSDLLWSDSE